MEDDIHMRLGRMEGKLDMLIARSDDGERRLRKVEKKQWVVAGISIAITAFAVKLGILPPTH